MQPSETLFILPFCIFYTFLSFLLSFPPLFCVGCRLPLKARMLISPAVKYSADLWLSSLPADRGSAPVRRCWPAACICRWRPRRGQAAGHRATSASWSSLASARTLIKRSGLHTHILLMMGSAVFGFGWTPALIGSSGSPQVGV